MLEFKLLLILIAANGIPILLHWWFGAKFSKPLDAGILLPDGQPLFGFSKTWRGLLIGTLGAAVTAGLLGFSLGFSVGFSLLSLLGDLLSSFIKRRIKFASSRQFTGVDQVPEALVPLIVGAYWLEYGLTTIILVTLSFFLLNILASPLLDQLGIRQHPH